MKNRIITVLLSMLAIAIFAGCDSRQVAVENENTQETTEEVETGESLDIDVTEEPVEEAVTEMEKVDHTSLSLDSIEITEDGTGIAVYDGVNHDIILDLPENVEGAPFVIMLHGYGESASTFRQKTAFEQEANSLGYAVVYVTGAPSPEDSTSSAGWNSGIGISSNRDVEFLCALANDLCEKYLLNRDRVYAIGFSNGAFMTHRLVLEADDTFAAVVSVAGMMPENMWTIKPGKCEAGILQITGEKDDVVPKNSDGSAKFAKAPAIEEVMAYYIEKNKVSLSDTVSIGKKSTLEKYTSPDSNKQVWNIFIPDGRHSWPEESIVGFSTNQIILEFLETE